MARTSFRQGAASLLDVLDAQRVYRQTLLEYAQVRADLSIALVRLERAVGAPHEKARKTTALGIIGVMALVLVGCGERSTEPPPPPPAVEAKATTVPRSIQAPPAVRDRLKIETVALHTVPEVVTAPGEVALDLKQVAKITSRIDGQVDQIHVQLGDRVKTGQPIVSIRSLQLDQLIEEYLVGKHRRKSPKIPSAGQKNYERTILCPSENWSKTRAGIWRRRPGTNIFARSS